MRLDLDKRQFLEAVAAGDFAGEAEPSIHVAILHTRKNNIGDLLPRWREGNSVDSTPITRVTCTMVVRTEDGGHARLVSVTESPRTGDSTDTEPVIVAELRALASEDRLQISERSL